MSVNLAVMLTMRRKTRMCVRILSLAVRKAMKIPYWRLPRLLDVKLRSLFLAFAVSLGMLIIISTYTLTDGLQNNFRVSDFRRIFFKKEKKIVLLVTERRSGSSYLGKMFDHLDSFYLFEPLLPYTPSCGELKEERVKTLTNMLRCDFNDVPRAFEEAFKATQYPDNNAKCMDHTLCFIGQHRRLLRRYWKLCNSLRNDTMEEISRFFEKNSSDDCGYPLKPDILSSICKSANMVAYKVVRLCSLESLEPLYTELTSEGHNVYIIHLVRDPRAVVASRLDLGLDGMSKINAEREIDELCSRSKENLQYTEKKEACMATDKTEKRGASLQKDFFSDGRYLRVRFEDFALNSLQTVRDIYSFFGDDIPRDIESWIKTTQFEFERIMLLAKQDADKRIQSKAKLILAEMGQPFSTTRDPREVLMKWRYRLPYKFVEMTQAKCAGVFERMGYKVIQNQAELMNFSMPLY